MFLIVGIICAIICGFVAANKGRSVVAWVILGFLFGLIPLIIVACLPNLADQRQKEAYIAEENRRLREQLRQERIKGETFRANAAARLDAHDQHLNLDTRTLGPALAAGGDGTREIGGAAASGEEDPAWYYLLESETKGPVKAADISHMIRSGLIRRDTLVWSAALSEWQTANSVQLFTLDFLQAANS